MKTSNIILTAFSILFIVYVFGVAAEFRISGEKRPLFSENEFQNSSEGCISAYKNEISLPSFKILKLNKITTVGNIRFNDQALNTFSVYGASETELPELKYHTSGDTLFIRKMSRKGLCNEFTLDLAELPQKIIVDSMNINIFNTLDNLKILNLKGSSTSFQLLSKNNMLRSIDSISIDLNNSSIYSQSTILIKNIDGEALNNSSILLEKSKVESANVEVGPKSQIIINNSIYLNTDPSVKLIYQKMKQKDNLQEQQK